MIGDLMSTSHEERFPSGIGVHQISVAELNALVLYDRL